ncbi:hypothetical protein ACFPZ0_20535 [Streptomonospora nanhaiensis]|uniref:hypothetical protein n=1 Tax=Streptomonospora nanhaiensis TaxID=1323731 RepID=UPI001C999FF0|nr:hypothetical protein [Streptomonospora nanhaiensis]MBX9390735.1 hypothetical protein [Streptomonospora nanhaiensis]
MAGDVWGGSPTVVCQILDQVYPLPRYSAQQRLRAMVFIVLGTSSVEEHQVRPAAARLGVPDDVVAALVRDDAGALDAALARAGHGWDLLAALLLYSGGLHAEFATGRAGAPGRDDPAAAGRPRPPRPAAEDPRRRGRRARRERPREVREATAPPEGEEWEELDGVGAFPAADPRTVRTREELIEALRLLRVSAGRPSYREMERLSGRLPGGADPLKHRSRSHSTLRNLLLGEAEPTPVNVLAFVRGCGTSAPARLRAWEDACARVARAGASAAPPRRSRSDTGGHPSLR